MLSQASLVMVRNSIESAYSGFCDIIEFSSITSGDGSSYFEEFTAFSSVPCKLSFSSSNIARDTKVNSGIYLVATLFTAPELEIKPGSKIIVTQDFITNVFKNTGYPLIFSTHQEIKLRLFDEWA